MTTTTDIVNRALQLLGTRTTVTDAELAGNTSNEAIQANLALNRTRQRLLRMAPWACALKTANAVYVTSSPGTPENPIAGTTLWQPGQPAPPWNYEYQYPADCLRACWIIPATQTGFAGGVPITTAVTGGAASFWQGPPVKFVTQTDTFYSIATATPVVGGSGYALGDTITLNNPALSTGPNGAAAVLIVTGVTAGAVTSVSVQSQLLNTASGSPVGGSYFAQVAGTQTQASTSGVGVGATFNVTWNPPGPQRVLLCNQEFAILAYVQDVTNVDEMDLMFQEAWISVLAATIQVALVNDKKLANILIQEANGMISQARTSDANEGMTVNDVTPDWLRIRGIDFSAPYSGPFTGFDWGGMYPIFG